MYDQHSKTAIIQLFEKYNYTCISGETTELYKYCDLVFKHNVNDKVLKIEVEVKTKFNKIINDYPMLNVLPRKLKTKADFIIYINSGITSQMLILPTSFLKHFKNNIVELECSDHGYNYVDRFIQVPKELAKWYVIQPNGKPTEMEFFDEELAKLYQ